MGPLVYRSCYYHLRQLEWSLTLSPMKRWWFLPTPFLLIQLTSVAWFLLAFPLEYWDDWIGYYAWLLSSSGEITNLPPYLFTSAMCCIGCLWPNGSHTADCCSGFSLHSTLCSGPSSWYLPPGVWRFSAWGASLCDEGELIVPRASLGTRQHRAFSAVGHSPGRTARPSCVYSTSDQSNWVL